MIDATRPLALRILGLVFGDRFTLWEVMLAGCIARSIVNGPSGVTFALFFAAVAGALLGGCVLRWATRRHTARIARTPSGKHA